MPVKLVIRNQLFFWLTVSLGIIVSIVLFKISQEREKNRFDLNFNLIANNYSQAIENNIFDHIDILRSLKYFYDASDNITQEEFHEFTKDILNRHTDILNIAWIAYDHSSSLEIYYPIFYVEPRENNQTLLGFDLASEPIRRSAMEMARDSGNATMTAPIALLNSVDKESGYRLFIPVYRRYSQVNNRANRRNNLAGFMSILFRGADVISYPLQKMFPESVSVAVYDLNSSTWGKPIYHYCPWENLSHTQGCAYAMVEPVWRKDIKIVDRVWRVIVWPAPEFVQKNKTITPFVLLFFGLMVTVFAGLYLLKILESAELTQQLVEKRTAQLQQVNKDLELESSNREQISIALGKSEALFKSILYNIPGIFYRRFNDSSLTFEFISSKIEDISGYPLSDFVNDNPRDYFDIIHPDDKVKVKEIVRKAVDTRMPYSIEYRINHKDGRIRWVSERGQGFSEQGQLNIDGVIFDITEHKNVEESLLRISQFNAAILATIPFAMDIVDKNCEILYMNERFKQLITQDGIGEKCYKLYKDDKTQCKDCPLRQGIEMGAPKVMETEGILGGRVFQIIHAGLIYNEKKAVLEIFEDITERRRAEKRLQEVLNLKSEFISMVSHELRTPLTAIQEGIGIVADGSAGIINDEQKDFLSLAKRNVDRLARLINDVLDLQKLDSGKAEFELKSNDINDVVKEVWGSMQMLAKNKNLKFNIFLGENIPAIMFDRDKIIQVLTNLVNNAFSFTNSGSVDIITSRNDTQVCVAVRDTGIGIAQEDMGQLFKSFSQLLRGKNRKSGSTGLGLTISQKIINQHKGKLSVDSEYGKGSTFYFTLPINIGGDYT
jgi:PAS domain S-box-containing protein